VPLGAGAGCCWAGRRSEPNAALRLGRYDAMRCDAPRSSLHGPAPRGRQASERPASTHHPCASERGRGRGYFILAANLNARARRRGAIRANPRLIDRAWPAGLLATWRLQCIALHSPNLLTLPCGASRRACVA
jgi:hypothetical protein